MTRPLFAILIGATLSWHSTPILAACRAHMTPGSLNFFLAHPHSLLGRHPRGGQGLRQEVAAFATVTPVALKTIEHIVPMANAEQRQAIGAGLAYAEIHCAASGPEVVRGVRAAVEGAFDSEVARSYYLVLGAERDIDASKPRLLFELKYRIGLDRNIAKMRIPYERPFSPISGTK